MTTRPLVRCEVCSGTGRNGSLGGCRSCAGFGSVPAAQPTLFDGHEKTSSVRRSDPAPAKAAALLDQEGRASQKHRILRYVFEHGTITADEAFRELPEEGEDTERGDWSTRIGVLQNDGLMEKAGERPEEGRKGRVRKVMAYRLTDAGLRSCSVMFAGTAA